MNKYLKRLHIIENNILRKHHMKEANDNYPSDKKIPLTTCELKRLKKTWGGLIKHGLVRNRFWKVYSFYKFFNDIDENIVPNDFYYYCQSILNTKWSLNFVSHKANLHLFIPEKNRPRTIIYGINHHLYNQNNQVITKEIAINLLRSQKTFVYKKALYTGGGKDVKKYENASDKELEDILSTSDFIVQAVLEQSEFFDDLNSSSVNTIRMETLNLNGNCTLLSSFIRIGAKGNFVDNISEREGMVVGVDSIGRLSPFGLSKDYDKVYKSSSGKLFDGLQIPNFEAITNTITKLHSCFPTENLINWDVAIDKSGVVKIIEINLNAMNPLYHQIFNGPIFKERTKEVIDYIINHK